jgi:DegV family protein with EDD domain
MSNVLVMTDTTACLPKDIADKHGIKIVPASQITCEGKTYTEGVTISARQAYDIIKKDPDSFCTAAITPGILLEGFRKLAKEHPLIFFVTISSGLSAVAQSANVAADLLKDEFPNSRVVAFDSKTVAGAEGMIAIEMAKLAAKGKGLDELAKAAAEMRKKTGGVLMLETVGYTYRSGRMTKTEAIETAKSNIKPVNRMSDAGVMEFAELVTDRIEGLKKMIGVVKKDAAGVDALHFMVSHADAPDTAQLLVDLLKKEFKCLSMIVSDYSPVMGYSTGPGAIFVGFHPELNL